MFVINVLMSLYAVFALSTVFVFVVVVYRKLNLDWRLLLCILMIIINAQCVYYKLTSSFQIYRFVLFYFDDKLHIWRDIQTERIYLYKYFTSSYLSKLSYHFFFLSFGDDHLETETRVKVKIKIKWAYLKKNQTS